MILPHLQWPPPPLADLWSCQKMTTANVEIKYEGLIWLKCQKFTTRDENNLASLSSGLSIFFLLRSSLFAASSLKRSSWNQKNIMTDKYWGARRFCPKMLLILHSHSHSKCGLNEEFGMVSYLQSFLLLLCGLCLLLHCTHRANNLTTEVSGRKHKSVNAQKHKKEFLNIQLSQQWRQKSWNSRENFGMVSSQLILGHFSAPGCRWLVLFSQSQVGNDCIVPRGGKWKNGTVFLLICWEARKPQSQHRPPPLPENHASRGMAYITITINMSLLNARQG